MAARSQVKDGAIVMEKGKKMNGVTYAGKDFPKSDYEVVLEGKRIDGRDFFCTTTFPVGDGFCSLVVGGWGGKLTGISSINGSDASENETTSSMDFKRRQVVQGAHSRERKESRMLDRRRAGRRRRAQGQQVHDANRMRRLPAVRLRDLGHDRGRARHSPADADGRGEEGESGRRSD